MQATQVTSVFREFHRPNPLESWFASSLVCDVDFLDQAQAGENVGNIIEPSYLCWPQKAGIGNTVRFTMHTGHIYVLTSLQTITRAFRVEVGKVKLGWTWAPSCETCHASSHLIGTAASYLNCSGLNSSTSFWWEWVRKWLHHQPTQKRQLWVKRSWGQEAQECTAGHKRTYIYHFKKCNTLRKISVTLINNIFELTMIPTYCPAKVFAFLLVFGGRILRLKCKYFILKVLQRLKSLYVRRLIY